MYRSLINSVCQCSAKELINSQYLNFHDSTTHLFAQELHEHVHNIMTAHFAVRVSNSYLTQCHINTKHCRKTATGGTVKIIMFGTHVGQWSIQQVRMYYHYYGSGTVVRIASGQPVDAAALKATPGAYAACALTTWQHFSTWNDFMANILKVTSSRKSVSQCIF